MCKPCREVGLVFSMVSALLSHVYQDLPTVVSSYNGSALRGPFLPSEILLEFNFSFRMLFIDPFIINLLTGFLL